MKHLSLLIAIVISYNLASAQYCGSSNPSVCTPVQLSQPGFYPRSDSFPPVINAQNTSAVLQFQNFDTVYFGGTMFIMDSLHIDTVSNLPPGLCWQSSSRDNTFAKRQDGCILISGTPCGTPGEYKTHIIVTVYIPFAYTLDADAAGLTYFIRLNNAGEAVTPTDTLQIVPFSSYGVASVCGVSNPTASINANQSVCYGSVDTFTVTASGGTAPYTYHWASSSATLSCSNCINPSATLTGNDTVYVTVTDANNNTVSASANAGVINLNVSISVSSPPNCAGSDITFSGPINYYYTYRWINNVNDTITGSSLFDIHNLQFSDSGNYQLLVTDTGCIFASNILDLHVSSMPTVTLNLGYDTICSYTGLTTFSGGSPAGGEYILDGTSATSFNASTIATGHHVVTYQYAADSMSCINTAQAPFVVQICNGVNEVLLESDISVYPTPANNLVTLQSEAFVLKTVNPFIYDITGKMVNAAVTRNANKLDLNITSLANGTYLVKLVIDGHTVIKRFVKTE